MKTILNLKCDYCGKDFTCEAGLYNSGRKRKNTFCCREHKSLFQTQTQNAFVKCGNCGNPVVRFMSSFKKSKSGMAFCSRSCSITYNNTLRRKSRRSKCEKMLFGMMQKEFSALDVVANDKGMLDGLEVDISIPSLKIAIEWNGIVHFKPIYGQSKLDRVRELDLKKQTIAQQKGITLIVVPDLVSTKKKVQEAFSQISKFIHSIIDQ